MKLILAFLIVQIIIANFVQCEIPAMKTLREIHKESSQLSDEIEKDIRVQRKFVPHFLSNNTLIGLNILEQNLHNIKQKDTEARQMLRESPGHNCYGWLSPKLNEILSRTEEEFSQCNQPYSEQIEFATKLFYDRQSILQYFSSSLQTLTITRILSSGILTQPDISVWRIFEEFSNSAHNTWRDHLKRDAEHNLDDFQAKIKQGTSLLMECLKLSWNDYERGINLIIEKRDACSSNN